MSVSAAGVGGRALLRLSRIAVLAVLLCAVIGAGADGEREIVLLPPPADLVVAMRARVGQDFRLGNYPEEAATPAALYRFLSATHSVRTLLTRWPTVHATEFAIEVEGGPAKVVVFAANAAFTGDLVYAVSAAEAGYPRTIYVYRNR